MKQSTKKDSVTEATDDAASRVTSLHAAEMRLADRFLTLRDDLAAAEQAAGSATLAKALGESSSVEPLKRLAEIRDEQAAVERAIGEARRQRVEAIPAVWRHQASSLRDQAFELLAEAEQRQVRTDELLAALQEHEGCRYVPWTPDRPSGDAPPSQAVITYSIPATEALRNRAATLQRQATVLERQTVVQEGVIRATDGDHLAEQLRGYDPLAITPSLIDALAWYEHQAAVEQERRRRQSPLSDGFVDPSAPIGCELVWRDGAIDARRSTVTRP